MSESDVGIRVAAIRQNAGRFLRFWGLVPGRFTSKLKSPAGTLWARSIFAFGSASADSLSHDIAAAFADAGSIMSAAGSAAKTIFMVRVPRIVFRMACVHY